jgi:hypothetical protein
VLEHRTECDNVLLHLFADKARQVGRDDFVCVVMLDDGAIATWYSKPKDVSNDALRMGAYTVGEV